MKILASLLTCGILPDEENHGLGLEVCVLELRRVEVFVLVELLEGQQLVAVDGLQPVQHVLAHAELKGQGGF